MSVKKIVLDLRVKALNAYDKQQLFLKLRYRFVWILLNPIRFLRELYYFKTTKLNDYKPAFSLNPELGFSRVELPDDLVRECILDTEKRFGDTQRNSKAYLKELTNLGDYSFESAPFRLATSPEILASVSNYLGYLPLLYNITAMYSPAKKISSNEIDEWKGSQLFHRDDDDIRILKLWILCTDVDLENGPTTVLPSKDSERIARQIGYRQGEKIVDETPFASALSRLNFAVGVKGTSYATDTDNVFHFGSRTSNNEDRLVLMIHYVSPFNRHFRPLLGGYPKSHIRQIQKLGTRDLNREQYLSLRGYLR